MRWSKHRRDIGIGIIGVISLVAGTSLLMNRAVNAQSSGFTVAVAYTPVPDQTIVLTCPTSEGTQTRSVRGVGSGRQTMAFSGTSTGVCTVVVGPLSSIDDRTFRLNACTTSSVLSMTTPSQPFDPSCTTGLQVIAVRGNTNGAESYPDTVTVLPSGTGRLFIDPVNCVDRCSWEASYFAITGGAEASTRTGWAGWEMVGTFASDSNRSLVVGFPSTQTVLPRNLQLVSPLVMRQGSALAVTAPYVVAKGASYPVVVNGAAPGSQVDLLSNGALVGSATANASGSASFTTSQSAVGATVFQAIEHATAAGITKIEQSIDAVTVAIDMLSTSPTTSVTTTTLSTGVLVVSVPNPVYVNRPFTINVTGKPLATVSLTLGGGGIRSVRLDATGGASFDQTTYTVGTFPLVATETVYVNGTPVTRNTQLSLTVLSTDPASTTTVSTTSTVVPTTVVGPTTTVRPPTTIGQTTTVRPPTTTVPPTTVPTTITSTTGPVAPLSLRMPTSVQVGQAFTATISGKPGATVGLSVGSTPLGSTVLPSNGTGSVSIALWSLGVTTVVVTETFWVNGSPFVRTSSSTVSVESTTAVTTQPVTTQPVTTQLGTTISPTTTVTTQPGTTRPGTTTPVTTVPVTTVPPTTAPPTTSPGFAVSVSAPAFVQVARAFTVSVSGPPGATAGVYVRGIPAGSVYLDRNGSGTVLAAAWSPGNAVILVEVTRWTNGVPTIQSAQITITVS